MFYYKYNKNFNSVLETDKIIHLIITVMKIIINTYVAQITPFEQQVRKYGDIM